MKYIFNTVLFIAVLWCIPLEGNAEDLYSEKEFQSLVSDKKAFKVGDNVTLMVFETSEAEAVADSGQKKATGIGGSFSSETENSFKTVDLGVKSDNSGSTGRGGDLRAQLTVTVTEIDKTGKLFVTGSQEITVNREKQTLVVEGWLREIDIDTNNVALSTRLSEAKIEYTGDGEVEKTRKPGLFYRLFAWTGLL